MIVDPASVRIAAFTTSEEKALIRYLEEVNPRPVHRNQSRCNFVRPQKCVLIFVLQFNPAYFATSQMEFSFILKINDFERARGELRVAFEESNSGIDHVICFDEIYPGQYPFTALHLDKERKRENFKQDQQQFQFKHYPYDYKVNEEDATMEFEYMENILLSFALYWGENKEKTSIFEFKELERLDMDETSMFTAEPPLFEDDKVLMAPQSANEEAESLEAWVPPSEVPILEIEERMSDGEGW